MAARQHMPDLPLGCVRVRKTLTSKTARACAGVFAGRKKVNRFQLPLRLGFALTDQKSQDQTLHSVIYIPDSNAGRHETYVPLSHVRTFDSLLIVAEHPLDNDAIACNVT